NAGQIIGQFNTANGQYHAFLYSGGKATDLGTLGGSPNRAFYSVASAINNAGTVVGESGPNFGLTRAFVFTNGKLTDLNSMVPANSGWVLDSAFAINNKGSPVDKCKQPAISAVSATSSGRYSCVSHLSTEEP